MSELFITIFATFLPSIMIGLFIGLYIAMKNDKTRNIGVLKIDDSDPMEEPYLFLELSGNVNNIMEEEYVTLKVDATGYVTQN